MSEQIFRIEISASSVAWYGAIVATISVIIVTLNYWRDKARIKISYKRNMRIVGIENIYDPDRIYFNISVINRGRRPIKIEKAGIKIIDKRGLFLLGDSFAKHREKVLTEENPRTDFFVDQSEIELTKIWYIAINDGAGREYRKYFYLFPTLWWLYYFLRFRK